MQRVNLTQEKPVIGVRLKPICPATMRIDALKQLGVATIAIQQRRWSEWAVAQTGLKFIVHEWLKEFSRGLIYYYDGSGVINNGLN